MRVPKKSSIYFGATLAVVLAIFAMPYIVLNGATTLVKPLADAVAPKPQITKSISFTAPHHVAYNVERVNIDKTGATLRRSGTTAELLVLNTISLPERSRITDFIENADKPPGTSITYHVSTNSQNWLFYDGNLWKPVGDCSDCSNTASELAGKLNELSFDTGAVRLKAILTSTGPRTPALRSVDIVTAGEEPLLPFDLAQEQNDVRSALASNSPPEDECECEGKVSLLTLRYNGAGPANVEVKQKKPSVSVYENTVDTGDTFTFIGADQSGTLSTEIYIFVDGVQNTSIHTSCSVPVDIGMTFGDFTITYGESRVNGPFCPPPPPPNLPPVAEDDTATTSINVPVTLSVIDNDFDPDGVLDLSSLVLQLGTGPTNGTATINTTTGESTYTPNTAFVGVDSYDYEICDDDGACDTATVTITVTGPAQCNLPPVAVDDTVSTTQDDDINVSVLANDSDPDNQLDLATLRALTEPSHGDISVDTVTGVITYAPDSGYTGADSFVYEICDNADGDAGMCAPHQERCECTDDCGQHQHRCQCGHGQENCDDTSGGQHTEGQWQCGWDCNGDGCDDGSQCDTATVYVQITGGGGQCNLPPIAVNDEATTSPGTAVDIDVVDNDFDPDGSINPSTVTVTTFPSNGTSSVNTFNGEVTYTPSPGFIGQDTFVYRVCDYGNAACTDDGDTGSGSSGSSKDDKSGSSKDGISFGRTIWHGLSLFGIHRAEAATKDSSSGSSKDDTSGSSGGSGGSGGSEESNPGVLCDIATVTVTVQDGPPESPVRPILECVEHNVNGSFTAHFGYLNENLMAINIPIGEANKFTPAPQDQGQPTTFASGRTDYYPNAAFNVDFAEGNLVWTLTGPDGGTRTATASQNVEQKCPEPPWDNSHLSVDGMCVENTDVVFTIANEGEPILGDMEGPVQYRVYRNGIQIDSGTVQLDGGETYVVTVLKANGDDISIQVDQRPGHPTGAPAIDTVTECGNTTTNDPPVAEDDSAQTLIGVPVDIDILINDYDPDGYLVPSTVVLIGTNTPQNGTVTFNLTTGEATYTPDTGFVGTDDFDYQICDNEGACDTATVTITVITEPNDPPVAVNDSRTTSYNTPVTVPVLNNDYDPDGFLVPATVALVPATGPANGSTSINPTNGEITYTPSNGFAGTNSFDYEVCDDDGACDTATVTVVVLPPANLPPVAEDDSTSTQDCTPVVVNVLANDSDPDGYLVPASVLVTVPPAQGSTTVNLTTGTITYSVCGYTGIVTFVYKVCDNEGLCDTATVTITVTEQPNDPPVALNDSAYTPFNTPVTVDVMNNDSDPDGYLVPSSVHVVSGTGPANGSTSVNPTNGKITYTPNTGFSGVDSFNYEVCDNDGACDTATVTIVVGAPPNVPPIAVNDSVTTPFETPIQIYVLNNDTDPDGYLVPSTVALVPLTGPNFGSTSISPTTGVVTYTPNAGFAGVDVFDYKVCDNDGACDTATVTITVETEPKEPPVAVDDYDEVDYMSGSGVDVDVLLNDSDPDGFLVPSTVTLVPATGPSHGVVTGVNPTTGEINFVPAPNYSGPDQFDYEVCDDDGLCDTATVFILIKPPNLQPPVAVDDYADVAYMSGSGVYVDVLDNDSDPDGYLVASTVSVVPATGPAHGTVVGVNPTTGEINFVPAPNYSGPDQFDYEVCDDDGLCDTATVFITILPPVNQPPTAVNDYKETTLNTPVNINVPANDTDPENDLDLTSVVVLPWARPANGTTSVNPTTGVITYTPDTGFVGTDYFDYEICDGDGLCDEATVIVVVGNPPNQPPVAVNDSKTTTLDTPVAVNVLLNDTDPDGFLVPSTVTVLPGFGPSNGTTSVNPTTGFITYTPDTGYLGTDSFDYEVCDNDGACDDATVTITVNAPLNLPPVAVDDSKTTPYNTPVLVDILANDSDPDGYLVPSSVIVVPSALPNNGSTSINPTTGAITYTPNTGYVGLDDFDYEVCDDDGLCDTATVYITVNSPPNLPPIAVDDTDTTPMNTPVTIDILDNDSDPDGFVVPSTTTLVSGSGPTHGGISINPVSGAATYTPATGYVGTDSFDYRVCDNDGACDTATVTITIEAPPNLPPIALDDSDSTLLNTPVIIDILANDSDPDGFLVPSTVIKLPGTGPLHGGVTINPTTGAATYTPATGYVGTDSFDYEVCDDDGACDTAKVTIIIGSPPNLPPIAVDDNDSTPKNTPVIIDLLENDSDPDGFLVPSTVIKLPGTGPLHGGVTINPTTGAATYTPATGYVGTDSFDYEVCDDDGACDDATVTITITEAPNLPPIAVDDNKTTNQNVPVDIALLANDSDPDGFLVPSTVRVIPGSGPAHGSVTINPANGVATYTPTTGYVGTDSFDYEVCDDDGACDTATATIVIKLPDNDPPVAVDDSKSTPMNTPVVVDVLANDSDPDGYLVTSSVTLVPATGPSNGSTSINPTTGEITYTPDSGYIGTDSFDYEVCDDDGLCDTATVTITVYYDGPENDPPIANDDVESTDMDVPVTVDVLTNDSDPDGYLIPSSVHIVSGSGPSNGSSTVNPTTGEITYTPDSGYIGTDSFDYEVCDNEGACDTATVTINVYPPEINEPPVALNDSESTQKNQPVTIQVLSNDTDSDGVIDPTTVELVPATGPSNGSISINPTTGEITYTPDSGFVGNDIFDYKVCDDDGLCDTATVTVTVYEKTGPHNLPPIANNDGATTLKNVPVEINLLINDYDQDGLLVPSTTIVLTQTSGVSISINAANGKATYTPPLDFVGTDSFTYQVCDSGGACDNALATIVVSDPFTPLPVPPIANNDSATTNEATPVEIQVMDNDSDADGYLVPASVSIFNGPSHGSVVENTSGTVTYTPNAGFSGVDTFEYEICDDDGLCDTAMVTVTVRPGNRQLIPPVANTDAIYAEYESITSIPVLDNDFDVDGYLIIPSLRVLTPPANGLATPSSVTGTITYLPDNGFSGVDTLLYEICDDDGLCDTARVTITVLPPFVPPPPPIPPSPPLPPAIPPIVIPIPELPIVPSVLSLNCGVPSQTTGDVTYTGTYTGNLANIASIEYSLLGGQSWRAIVDITPTATGATFRFVLTDLPGGDYRVRTRAVTADNARTGSVSSTTCQFTIDNGLVFGANQFILGAQPSPMADSGTLHFTLNQRHRFYLEAKGASEAYLRIIDTEEIYPLVWDYQLKLWTGILSFDKAGFNRIEATISNGRRSYTREINSILVTQGTDITDIETGELIKNLVITVYEKEPASEDFQVWNAQAYAQSNPVQSDGGFAFVVPPGDFYVVISHPGYDPITSLITRVPEQSVISANLQLDTTEGFFGRISRLFTRQGTVNNFPLSVRPAPDTELLENGDFLPNINLTDSTGATTTLYDQISNDERPTVVFVYSTWNTNAQMQIDIFRQLTAKMDGHVRFVPVATMEPEQLQKSQIIRGAYGFEFFQPTDDFYDDFSIISLPAFYAVDSDRVLQGTLFGPRSLDAIENWVETTLNVNL